MFNLKAEILFYLAGRECVPMSELYSKLPRVPPRKILATVHSLCVEGVTDVLFTGNEITEVEIKAKEGLAVMQ